MAAVSPLATLLSPQTLLSSDQARPYGCLSPPPPYPAGAPASGLGERERLRSWVAQLSVLSTLSTLRLRLRLRLRRGSGLAPRWLNRTVLILARRAGYVAAARRAGGASMCVSLLAE
jgi:hypothetical protein